MAIVSDPAYIKFDDVITIDNLLVSYNRARRGKSLREKVVFYHMDVMKNLHALLKKLRNGTYEIGQLSRFKVYEPKEREVIANMFEDKIVQDILAKKVLEPLLAPKLVYDNYASQPGKGTHKALQRLERFTMIHAKAMDWKAAGYVLVCDLSKFFYNIDQHLCWELVRHLPIDPRLQHYLYLQIMTCTPEINPYTDLSGKGLCIGFQTSQWLAVYYLDKLDHYIKEVLGIKCYGRYMDDFYLIHESQEYLEECYEKIREFCKKEIYMDLNEKTHIHPFSQGICFLGYRVTYDESTHSVVTVIRRKSINKMLKRVKRHVDLIKMGLLTQEVALESLDSWYAYAKHGEDNKANNAYHKARKMIEGQKDAVKEYHKLCEDWWNIEPEGFYKLHVNKKNTLRDVDGYAILMPKKQTKREEWLERKREEVAENPERYMESNLDLLIHMKPEDFTKLRRKRGKKHKTASDKLEFARRSMSPLV